MHPALLRRPCFASDSLLTYKIGRTQSGATLEFQEMWSCWLYDWNESSALSNLVFSIFDKMQISKVFSSFYFLFVYFSVSVTLNQSKLQLRLNIERSGKTKKKALLRVFFFGLTIGQQLYAEDFASKTQNNFRKSWRRISWNHRAQKNM